MWGLLIGTRVGQELAAISTVPTPDPKDWVFSSVNNRLIDPHGRAESVTPETWVGRGKGRLEAALAGREAPEKPEMATRRSDNAARGNDD